MENAQPVAQDATKADNLWLQDGNIVLQAEDILFRVHKSILSIHSALFRDMFAVPQPKSQEGDSQDGLPIVRLHDSATDLTHFLTAIYYPGTFENVPAKVTFTAVIGILRISSKYDVGWLFRRATTHLETMYPSTLEAWDSVSPTVDVAGVRSPEFTVLNVARVTGLTWVIPAVLYDCSLYSVDCIFYGIEPGSNGSRIELRNEDKQLCIKVARKLTSLLYKELLYFLRSDDYASGCVGSDNECLKVRHGWLAGAFEVDGEYSGDPLRYFDELNWEQYASEVCSTCLESSKRDYHAAREWLWVELPKICDLPEWGELNTYREDFYSRTHRSIK